MGKRKFKEEQSEEGEGEAPLDKQQHGVRLSLPNGHGHPSSSSACTTASTPLLNGGAMMVNGLDNNNNGGQHHVVWMIRKPINMPLETLKNIHFSRKPSLQCQTFSSTSSAAAAGSTSERLSDQQQKQQQQTTTKFECHLKKTARPMLHVISDRKRTFDEKVPMTQGPCLRGVVWINSIELQRTKTGDQKQQQEDELLQLDDDDDNDCETVPSSIQIGSIRRKPVVDEQTLKERLKAFGSTQTAESSDGGEGRGGEGVKKMRRK